MKRPVLETQKRTVFGKKVKQLRREGLLPAAVFGKDISSESIQVKQTDFEAVYKEAGTTGVIDLHVGEAVYPVLIRNVHFNNLRQEYLHADFNKVNLKEKIKSIVPIVLIGEAKAVSEKVGQVLQNLSEVEVEALPTDLPEHIEIDVTALAEVGDQLLVRDMAAPKQVDITTDPSQVVVSIAELVAEEEPVEEAPSEGESEATSGEEAEQSSEEEASASSSAAAETSEKE